MDLNEVNGKRLALLVVSEEKGREEEWMVFAGTARWDDHQLFFERPAEGLSLPIPDDTLDRIRPVTDDVRDIFLGAAFYVPLSISTLPANADTSRLIKTGLKWPGEQPEEKSP